MNCFARQNYKKNSKQETFTEKIQENSLIGNIYGQELENFSTIFL